MENKKIWIWLVAILFLYLIFKENKPKPVPVSPYTYERAYPNTFHGRACLGDCSGHEAGYQWAEDRDIDDVDDCTGYSQSFIEGCIAYVEENH
jgi:hypothetical protein